MIHSPDPHRRLADGAVAGIDILRNPDHLVHIDRRLKACQDLLLTFDRHGLYGLDRDPVETEPEPEGMSGAGVWRLTPTPESDTLVAIVGSHSDSGRLIYAARMNILVDSLDDFVVGRLS